MKKLTTTTIAVALATGSAFAGSDHFGSIQPDRSGLGQRIGRCIP